MPRVSRSCASQANTLLTAVVARMPAAGKLRKVTHSRARTLELLPAPSRSLSPPSLVPANIILHVENESAREACATCEIRREPISPSE